MRAQIENVVGSNVLMIYEGALLGNDDVELRAFGVSPHAQIDVERVAA